MNSFHTLCILLWHPVQATVVFTSLVGASVLQLWDRKQYDTILVQYAKMATRLLYEAGGYLVELTSAGLCLAAFDQPLHAIAWGLFLIEAMKVWGN